MPADPNSSPPPPPGGKPRRRPQPSVGGNWIWLVILLVLVGMFLVQSINPAGSLEWSEFQTLLEQGKLTSGSTWHAAGLVGQLRSSASITQVLKRSVELYKTLEAETGLATGWKMTGCLRLATTDDRWTEFKRLATTAIGMPTRMQWEKSALAMP